MTTTDTDTVRSADDAYPPQTPRHYLNLSAFWLALSFLWAGMITIVMQTLVHQMVGDEKKDLYLGWALALGALVSTVICLIIGTISDRSRSAMGKRRPYILWGTILSIPALMWLPAVQSIGLLIVCFCLIQLTVNAATSPYQALIPDTVPKERQGTASAYMGMGSLVGQLAGLILCGVLIARHGKPGDELIVGGALIARHGGLWLIMATISAALLVTMAWTLLTIREHSAVDNPAPQKGLLATLVDAFRINPREHPDFFWLIASRFVINMGFYSATEFLLYYVKDTLHATDPVKTVTTIFVIVTVAGLAGNFPAGILSDRVSKKLVIYISAAITATSALIFLLSTSIPVAYAASFVFGIGFGAFMAVDWALATNLIPDYDEAKFMGVWHVAFTVPQVVAPLIGGLVAYFFNNHVAPGFGYRVVLFLVMVYLGFGTLLIRPVRERVIPKA